MGSSSRWASFLEQLFIAEPPREQLLATGVWMLAAGLPVGDVTPSPSVMKGSIDGGQHDQVEENKRWLGFWRTGTIPPDWERRLVIYSGKGKGIDRSTEATRRVAQVVCAGLPGKDLTYLFLARAPHL